MRFNLMNAISRERVPEAVWPRIDYDVIGDAFKIANNATNKDPNIKWFVVGCGVISGPLRPDSPCPRRSARGASRSRCLLVRVEEFPASYATISTDDLRRGRGVAATPSPRTIHVVAATPSPRTIHVVAAASPRFRLHRQSTSWARRRRDFFSTELRSRRYPFLKSWGYDLYPCSDAAADKGYPQCGPNSLYNQEPPGAAGLKDRERSQLFQFYEDLAPVPGPETWHKKGYTSKDCALPLVVEGRVAATPRGAMRLFRGRVDTPRTGTWARSHKAVPNPRCNTRGEDGTTAGESCPDMDC